MNTPTAIVLAVTLGLVSCKSEEEKARQEALEKRADQLDDQAKATTDAAKKAAKDVKEAGEAKADELKDQAEKTREQK